MNFNANFYSIWIMSLPTSTGQVIELRRYAIVRESRVQAFELLGYVIYDQRWTSLSQTWNKHDIIPFWKLFSVSLCTLLFNV
jgi:hypothetical protein